jgi:glycosyltransferase involved in cell wall biosynthesis
MVENKIKIFMFEPSGGGGISHYSIALANALGDSTITDLTLITNKYFESEKLLNINKLNLEKKVIKLGPSLLKFFPFKKLKIPLNVILYCISWMKILLMVKKEKPDIFHIQSLQAQELDMFFINILKNILNSFAGTLVITAHNSMPHEPRKLTKYSYKKIYECSDKLITHTHFDKQEITNIWPETEKKISVIPHGNYSLLYKDIKVKKKYPSDFNILFFGYIRPYKGVEFLIKGVSLMKNKKNVKLWIVGNASDSYKKELEDQINLNGLTNSIEFISEFIPTEDIPYYMNQSDVLVLPYTKVSMSGVLHVGMIYEKPIIVTDVGGLPEVIVNGETGYVVNASDEDSIAKALDNLYDFPDMRSKMGKKAKCFSETKFSWESISKETIKLYKDTLE